MTLHRLNRSEIDNTFRDLLLVDAKPARDFPHDDVGYGFDNIADVLSTSPLLVEKLELAAEQVVAAALKRPRLEPDVFRLEAETVGSEVGAAYRNMGWNLWSNGEITSGVTLTDPGDYRFSARVFAQQAGPDLARAALAVDRQEVHLTDVTGTEAEPQVISIEVRFDEPGPHQFGVLFLNDFYDPDNADPAQRDRNLYVDWLQVEGPLHFPPPPDPSPRDRLLTCDAAVAGDEACAREILAAFGRRAWRRPLEADEMTRLLGLVGGVRAEGDDFETALSVAMRALLLSPNFLYRVEIDPDPASTEPHALSPHELAARISYFLWSSTPDDALLDAADAGRLTETAEIETQVRRMLADPRADALVDNFGGQWLYTRAMDDVAPDYATFPSFDDELRASMSTETRLFFGEFLRSDRSALEMFSARFTYLDDRLARHYGVEAAGEPVGDGGFRRVEFPADSARGGLLTQGSVLTVTSFPRRTSPVKRGKWLLEQMLCAPPPPPPPGVENRINDVDPNASLRQRLEQHRANPDCAVCHNSLDPLGFGLDHFDGVGAWRDQDGRFPIDARGTLPDGRAFDGATELSAILQADPEVSRCMSQQLFIYALGRGPTLADRCALEAVEARFAEGGHRLSDLAVAIAQSAVFRQRRGQPPGEARPGDAE